MKGRVLTMHKGFTISPEYKNANVAKVIVAVKLEMNKTNEVCKSGIWCSYTHWHLILHALVSSGVNKELSFIPKFSILLVYENFQYMIVYAGKVFHTNVTIIGNFVLFVKIRLWQTSSE